MKDKETPTREDLKAFLNQYREANRGIQRLEARRRIMGLSATRPEAGSVAAELASRIAAKRKDLAGIALLVLDVIDLLPDGSVEKDIIEMRHLHDMSWREVIKAVGFSRSPCFLYYNRALNRLLKHERVRELLEAASDCAADKAGKPQ